MTLCVSVYERGQHACLSLGSSFLTVCPHKTFHSFSYNQSGMFNIFTVNVLRLCSELSSLGTKLMRLDFYY